MMKNENGKTMKNIIQMMVCLAVTMVAAGNIQAQMTAAKKIPPAVEKKLF